MKKKLFLLTATTLIVGGTTVFGEAIRETITGILSPETKLMVEQNGVNLSHTPIIIDGTTYLPVRDVAEIMGQSVGYDAETKTIMLGVSEEVQDTTSANQTTSDGAVGEVTEAFTQESVEQPTEDVSESSTEQTTEENLKIDLDVLESFIEQPDVIIEDEVIGFEYEQLD